MVAQCGQRCGILSGVPTRRLFGLLLLAAPIGAAGGPLVLLAVAVAALALLAAAVDWLLAGDGQRLVVRRVLASDKLSLGAWNLVRIELRNETARAVHVLIRDLPPPASCSIRACRSSGRRSTRRLRPP